MRELKPTSKLNFFLARMACRGFSYEQVLAGTTIREEQLARELFRPTAQQSRRIILNLIELTQNPSIGIALGAEFKISYLGVLGYAALSAATLGQSRELLTKYRALAEHFFTSVNHINNERWWSEIRDTLVLGDLMHFAVEEFASETMALASSLTGRPFPILELHVTYPQPAAVGPYLRRFNCPLYFNQPRNIVVFDIRRLHDAISFANEEVFSLCERQCHLIVSRTESTELVSNRIRHYLVRNPGRFPSLEEMAQRLNMGSRTLRRRLAAEKVTYQQILDDIRRELAIQYLENTALTPKEIGFLLGYSSVSNLRRAFAVWTGKRLSDYRRSERSATPAADAAQRPL